jgi:hypothetical protein
MPCRMDDMPDTSKEDLVKIKKEGDKATKYLCEVLSILEKRTQGLGDFSLDIQRWWRKHQKVDQKRAKREKIEAQISKLQDELNNL